MLGGWMSLVGAMSNSPASADDVARARMEV
jgi:hypothetical protein